MPPRFTRARLITRDDPRYRAFMRQLMLSKSNERASRPPAPRDLFGKEAETALRDWLAAQLPLSERRFLEYVDQRERSGFVKYREIDAVSIIDPRSIEVFEIKASRNASSVRRALRQLDDTSAILGTIFPRVRMTILLVDTGIPTPEEVILTMAASDAPKSPPPTLDDVLEAVPRIRLVTSLDERDANLDIVSLLRLGVADIIALVGAENLHLNWDEEPDEQPSLPEPSQTAYSSDDPSDEDNPFAVALRHWR